MKIHSKKASIYQNNTKKSWLSVHSAILHLIKLHLDLHPCTYKYQDLY